MPSLTKGASATSNVVGTTNSNNNVLLVILGIFFSAGFVFFSHSRNHIREHAINPSWPIVDPLFSEVFGWRYHPEFVRGILRHGEDLMREFALMLIFRFPYALVSSLFSFLVLDLYFIQPIRLNLGFRSSNINIQVLFTKFDFVIGLILAISSTSLTLGLIFNLFSSWTSSSSSSSLLILPPMDCLSGFQSLLDTISKTTVLFFPLSSLLLLVFISSFLFFGWGSARSNERPFLKGWLLVSVLSLPLISAAMEVLESLCIILLLYFHPIPLPFLASLGGFLSVFKHSTLWASFLAVILAVARQFLLFVTSATTLHTKTN
jgi:hypothetical protein